MPGNPSITISQHHRFASPPRYPPFSAAHHASAAPTAIPRAQDAVPPALPPPNYIPEISQGHDPGWQWGNDPNGADFGRPASVKPGSSLLGGALMRSVRQEKEQDHLPYHSFDDARRGSSISTVTVTRDYEASEGMLTANEDDCGLSRPPSNYRYVVFIRQSASSPCATRGPFVAPFSTLPSTCTTWTLQPSTILDNLSQHCGVQTAVPLFTGLALESRISLGSSCRSHKLWCHLCPTSLVQTDRRFKARQIKRRPF